MSKTINPKLPPHALIYIASLILVVLTSCILSPIYMQIGNDVVFMYTYLPTLLNFVILLFETMYLALIFAGVAYSVYSVNSGTEKKAPAIIYPIAVIFIKHSLNLIVSSIIDSYIDFSFDIPVTILLICIDVLMAAIVWFIADIKSKKHLTRVKKIMKATKYLTTVECDIATDVYPFGGFFNFKNPILISIFVGAIVTTAAAILQRMYADVFVLGVPATFYEIIEIFVAYLFDIILGAVGYVVSYFAASYIFLSEQK